MQNASFIIPAGVTEFVLSGDSFPQEIASDCERVDLLYRLSNVPNIVYLKGTEIDALSVNWSNILPTPLHSDHAIVTAL